MHHPFLFGGGVEPPTKFSKKGGGGLTGPQLLVGFSGKQGADFFQGNWNFQPKKKKCEIFNDKKSL